MGAGARLGGAALRTELAEATDEIIGAVRAEVPDYARPLTGRFGMRITEGVSVALGQFVDLIGRDEGPEDMRVYRALGQLEHREGRTLAALQSAYQVGTRTMWRRLGEGPTAQKLPAEVIFSLAEALFTYVEQISAASVAGWADEEANRAGSLQARRHALVELLARRPPAAAAEVERVAAAAGWTLPPRLAALVVPDAVAVAARLPGAIGAHLDPVGVALVPAPERSSWLDRLRAGLAGRTAVVGPGGGAGAGVPVDRAGAGGLAAARGRAAAAGLGRTAWPAPTSTCWRCCWPPSRSSPPTCANGRWPRCGRCRPARPRAASRRCGPGSRRTATWARRRPRCTCTRRPCATGWPGCASCSAARWTTRPPGSS